MTDSNAIPTVDERRRFEDEQLIPLVRGATDQVTNAPRLLSPGSLASSIPTVTPPDRPRNTVQGSPNPLAMDKLVSPAQQKGGVGPRLYQEDIPQVGSDRSGNPITPLSPEYFQQQRARSDFQQENHLGTPLNHPGFAGKLLHGLSVAGNVAGDILAPGTMSLIPGTQLHNQLVRGQQQKDFGQAEENQLRDAESSNQRALAEGNELTDFTLPDGSVQQIPAKAIPAFEEAYGKNQNAQTIQGMKDTTAQTVQSMKGDSAANVAGIHNTGAETVADINQTGANSRNSADILSRENIARWNNASKERISEANRLASAARENGKVPAGLGRAYDQFQDAVLRDTTMHQSVEPASRGDQQAMLNILAAHIGMTTGAIKGMRNGAFIIEEAEKSAPWLGRINAKFDKDGYLTGVTLTPQQIASMVSLADTRLGDEQQRFQNEQTLYRTGGQVAPGANEPVNTGGGSNSGSSHYSPNNPFAPRSK